MTQPHQIRCIIQPNSSGIWHVVDDSDHGPVGVPSSTSLSVDGNGYLVVPYTTAFTKIYNGYTVIDDGLTIGGIICGASYGFNAISIKFHKEGTAGAYASTSITSSAYPGCAVLIEVNGEKAGSVDGTGTMFAPTSSGTGTGVTGYTTRYEIPKTSLTLPSGAPTKIRITVKAAPSEAYTSDGIYIDHKGTGAIDYATSSPGQFLFSGSGTIALSAGQEVVSDWLAWAYNKTSDLVIGEHCSGDTSHDGRSAANSTATGVSMYLKASASEAANQTVTTASYDGPYSGYLQLVTKIETDGF